MKSKFDVVISRLFGDSWHVGLFREGNCLSWSSFSSRAEAENWSRNPVLRSADAGAFALSAN